MYNLHEFQDRTRHQSWECAMAQNTMMCLFNRLGFWASGLVTLKISQKEIGKLGARLKLWWKRTLRKINPIQTRRLSRPVAFETKTGNKQQLIHSGSVQPISFRYCLRISGDGILSVAWGFCLLYRVKVHISTSERASMAVGLLLVGHERLIDPASSLPPRNRVSSC